MLILTKKYELIEINLVKFLSILVAIVLIIALIGGLATNIPNNVSIAISIPLSLIATSLWELSMKKKNKIFDEEGIETLLTKIAEGDIKFTYNFSVSFIKSYNRNERLILKLNKSSIVEEVLLLVYFIQSSFPELKRNLIKPEKVKDLFHLIITKNSLLENDYGISFNNLAFLYEVNTLYLYHNFQIGSKTKLNYELKDQGLLIQKSFLDIPIFTNDDGFEISNGFRNHPYKIRYAEVLSSYLYSLDYLFEKEASEINYKDHFYGLYNLFLEIKDNSDFLTLALHTAYDLVQLMRHIERHNISFEEVLASENANPFMDLKMKFITYIRNSPTMEYFILCEEDFTLFKDNFNDFHFSEIYADRVSSVYESELNRNLVNGQFDAFVNVYNAYVQLKKSDDDIGNWQILYEKFYRRFAFNEKLRFDDVIFSFNQKSEKYNRLSKHYFEGIKLRLMVLNDELSPQKISEIIVDVFSVQGKVDFFKSIPVYNFQSFDKFSQYLVEKDNYPVNN